MNSIPRITVPVFKEQQHHVNLAIQRGELVVGRDLDGFKTELRNTFQRQYVALSNSGHSALMASLRAMGLNGKRILLPALSTCFAITNAIKSSGNFPVYGDLELSTGNLDVTAVAKLRYNFDAILSPNYFGIASDIESFKSFDVPVIEDACQSYLTSMGKESSADAQVFSFYPTKILNAIDGGASLVKQESIYQELKNITYYDHQEAVDDETRYNIRMPNLHAAFGLGTMANLDKIILRNSKIIEIYDDLFANCQVASRLGPLSNKTLSRYVLRFNSIVKRELFMNKCLKAGIGVSKEFMALVKPGNSYPNASRILDTTCSIPLHYQLTDNILDYLMTTLNQIIKELV
ncbi:DegT/DnrJ/EryC1/StrS family aminotransferase [Roseivirga sp. E12]|uniref:DegT/DnrJ/EryC1/StrS family aminotransferase n=1 Tax=Roseivirga sp. E12 TaxID=2819237 RepID=UPI001ABCD46C|nr:DegT/DnrJ/EryC1/StrS family aminotransferase [Roseivirga sp. E12]MBO3699755.1 DegT/DnrJ/EryC1/StrS aminotransferase family protein [Roseivirga sp. E12]